MQTTELAYILYNDQKPTLGLSHGGVNAGGSRRGHTKGKDRPNPRPPDTCPGIRPLLTSPQLLLSLRRVVCSGVVVLDKHQGFWLVHSTPHFPPAREAGYSYPISGLVNGQNFICVTYPLERFQTIGEPRRGVGGVRAGPRAGPGV